MIHTIDWETIGQEAVAILQRLIQFDTTNPPGNERPAAEYLQQVLARDGIASEILESASGRANLVARLKGDGSAGPLLLLGHTDVVYADPTEWTHPPFGGEIHEECVWGRGALDMKNLVTMELVTLLLIKRLEIPLARDVIFLAVADEENMGTYGAEWVLAHHRDKIDAEYVLNEGGRGIELLGREVYLVSTAEKGYGDLQLTARGNAGHSAMPHGRNPVVEISRALVAVHSYQPPYQLTTTTRETLAGLGELLGVSTPVDAAQLPDALVPLLKRLPEEVARMLRFGLRDVLTPTMVHAGIKENVIPNQATANVNTRTLPGVALETLLDRVQEVSGPGIQIDVKRFHPGTESPTDSPLLRVIEEVMQEAVPGCTVMPYLLPATTDSRFFRHYGIKAYGFFPVALPLELSQTIHGKDERIPVRSLQQGLERFFQVVTRFCGKQ